MIFKIAHSRKTWYPGPARRFHQNVKIFYRRPVINEHRSQREREREEKIEKLFDWPKMIARRNWVNGSAKSDLDGFFSSIVTFWWWWWWSFFFSLFTYFKIMLISKWGKNHDWNFDGLFIQWLYYYYSEWFKLKTYWFNSEDAFDEKGHEIHRKLCAMRNSVPFAWRMCKHCHCQGYCTNKNLWCNHVLIIQLPYVSGWFVRQQKTTLFLGKTIRTCTSPRSVSIKGNYYHRIWLLTVERKNSDLKLIGF